MRIILIKLAWLFSSLFKNKEDGRGSKDSNMVTGRLFELVIKWNVINFVLEIELENNLDSIEFLQPFN